MVQWLRHPFPMQGSELELRSYMLPSPKPKHKTEAILLQIKGLKMVHIKKKNLKKIKGIYWLECVLSHFSHV